MPANYYPPRSLKSCLAIAAKILEHGGQHLNRITLAEELGMKPESEPFRDMITTSGRHGITKGAYNATRIEVTAKAQSLVDHSPEAILETLFANPYFSKVHDRFKDRTVPSDRILEDTLKEFGLEDKYVVKVRKGVLDDMRDWQVIQTRPSGTRVVQREEALEALRKLYGKVEDSNDAPTNGSAETDRSGEGGTQPASPIPASEASSQSVTSPTPIVAPKINVSPNVQINIEIHIAADMPHDSIEKIFESMGRHLLKNEA